ncbi:MAG: sulfurtransferase [Candidatus Dormibacteria bacterium]
MPGTPLIHPAALRELLAGERPPTLLDARWRLGGPPGVDDYRQGHLPGATFVDLDRDLSGPPGRGRHPLPDRETFAVAMRARGVRSDRTVVVYDAADSTAAARAWWLLGYFGHPDARVLDGGLRAWVESGFPLSTDIPEPAPGDFEARPGGLPLLDADAAARVAHDGVLLDARALARYTGDSEPVDPVAGHIPGAHSAPTADNVDERGRFRDPMDLRRRFQAAGIREAPTPPPVGVYCGSGVTAAHEVLALQLAGIPAALYVGSWSEWISDPSRPVEKGEASAR